MTHEYPCCRCGGWFAPSEIVRYTNDLQPETDVDGNRKVHSDLLYCHGCDREIQNELQTEMIHAGYDPDQHKVRFE